MTDEPLHPDRSLLPVQRPTVVALHHEHGEPTISSWQVAVEAPVQISINGAPRSVMLATPDALEDLARGLAITERWISDPAAIESIAVQTFLSDVTVDLVVDPALVADAAQSARSMAGNTGCGLCGIESLAALQARPAATRTARQPVHEGAIRRAFDELQGHQPINAATRSVHAAAWCTMEGHVVHCREDVGRHNALDKLMGALSVTGQLDEAGFVVMTSRCSYELVYKATAANTQLLATISAPTTMALEWARALDLPLACTMRARDGAQIVVHFPQQPSTDFPSASSLTAGNRAG